MSEEFKPSLLKKSAYEKATGMNLSHVIFHRKDELMDAGALCKFGRHWMVDPMVFEQFIRQGGLADIAQ